MKKLVITLVLLLGWMGCTGSGLANRTDVLHAVIDGKTSDRVHLRESPSADSASLGLYFTGTEVRYLENTVDEWVWVNIGSEMGYIKSEYLHFENDPGSVTSQQPIGIVNNKNSNNWVNLRPDPNSKYAAIGKFYNGDAVTILGETATHWYYVKAGDQYGYIIANLVTMRPVLPNMPGAWDGDADALTALQSVLKNNTTFINASDNRAMKVSQLPSSIIDARIEITQCTVVDLDHDSIPEVVLWETANGNDYGVEVLHYQGGVIYGYELGYREFNDLKTDGTFSFSSSASDYGFGTLVFLINAYTIDKITYSQSSYSNNKSTITYFVNKTPAIETEFSSAVNHQEKKPDVTWYPFTTANIEAML